MTLDKWVATMWRRALGGGALTVAAVLGCALALTVTLSGASRSGHAASAATSQDGCTFNVPTPSVTRGRANFTVRAACTPGKDQRKLDVQLVANDPSYDDTLRAASTSIPAGTSSPTVTRSNWACQEDLVGRDEIYLRVRIEARQGATWQKAAWVNGSAVSVDCH